MTIDSRRQRDFGYRTVKTISGFYKTRVHCAGRKTRTKRRVRANARLVCTQECVFPQMNVKRKLSVFFFFF